ncbi:unnamed protein product [Spirodela intermedia]|uniref:Uncharacterized protein n=1 Tax=Spirodela intermedia TaxID=51605 RepID=A0A7I8KMQ7_SPIIN|nr:unnamed protein product [Spirodela intermedia]
MWVGHMLGSFILKSTQQEEALHRIYGSGQVDPTSLRVPCDQTYMIQQLMKYCNTENLSPHTSSLINQYHSKHQPPLTWGKCWLFLDIGIYKQDH